jgi:hypothetical protein
LVSLPISSQSDRRREFDGWAEPIQEMNPMYAIRPGLPAGTSVRAKTEQLEMMGRQMHERKHTRVLMDELKIPI